MNAPDLGAMLEAFETYASELATSGSDMLSCKVRDPGTILMPEERG